MSEDTRREFLTQVAGAAGAALIGPALIGCGGSEETTSTEETSTGGESETTVEVIRDESPPAEESTGVPLTKPEGWDPIAFNRDRGNAGAIPESYRDEINGPDGENGHLGKHLPYIPATDGVEVPEGYLAIMWGDPSLGRTKHPNAPASDDNPDGHWYDWVRVRKATESDADEAETTFGGWPEVAGGDSGQYAVLGGGDIEAESGKNTIYLVRLPSDVQPGDTVRIYAHCLTHGEYVDFIDLPAA